MSMVALSRRYLHVSSLMEPFGHATEHFTQIALQALPGDPPSGVVNPSLG